MKKMNLFAALILFLCLQSGFAQQPVITCYSSANGAPLGQCDYPCYGMMSPDEMNLMPLVTIALDFHFIRSGGLQFQCDDPSAPGYAPDYVTQILNESNDYFSHPEPNEKSPNPIMLKDTRFRTALAGNPSDPCDAIFFHDSEPASYSNPNAMHIVVINDDSSLTNIGGSEHGTHIKLYNLHYHVLQAGWTDVSVWGRTLNHELGHRFGLCHSFCEFNTCPDMDPAAECGGPTPGQAYCNPPKDSTPCPVPAPGSSYPESCGGNHCLYCYCTWGNGNNFMGYGFNRRGITPSQWGQMYGAMYSENPKFINFEYRNCEAPAAQSPIIIPANKVVEWNSARVVNQNIEVETGATLIIRCEVRMGRELSINVNRGARLFVLGGTITSQSPDCLWQGIWVQGNQLLEQPNPDIAQDTGQILNPNGAGVVWLNGATLKNAVTAVSTRSTGFTNYGGLIMAYGTDFVNNRRAVEFMRYGKKNKSYFSYVDVMQSGTPPSEVKKGISIWGCHGIKFKECHFDRIGTYDIFGIDFSARVVDCSFKHGDLTESYGFRAENTMPNVSEDTTIIENSRFDSLRVGVYSNASPNLIYPIFIKNGCRFTNGVSNASYGIRISGESKFYVLNNFFDNHVFSVFASSTGTPFNEISCNKVYNYKSTGIYAGNSNSELTILGNELTSLIGAPVRIAGSGQIATIGKFQGGPDKSAGNCFSKPVNGILAPLNNVAHFYYYVYNLDSNFVVCEKPTKNLNDGGNNNYTERKADNRFTEADCDDGQQIPPVTEPDLQLARQITAQKKAAMAASPQNLQYAWEYHQAAQWQDAVLAKLVKQAYESDNLEYAEGLLLGENTNAARRMVVGMRTKRGSLAEAQSLLNSMTDENQDDVWFKDIMAINFAIAQSQSPVQYQLSSQQESTLRTIAGAPNSIMTGYACALLSFCKGYTCTDEGLLEDFGFRSEERRDLNKRIEMLTGIRVFPNPGKGHWTIECPSLPGEILRVELFDFSGSLLSNHELLNNGEMQFNQETLPNGVYFLRLSHSGSLIYTTKLAVIR